MHQSITTLLETEENGKEAVRQAHRHAQKTIREARKQANTIQQNVVDEAKEKAAKHRRKTLKEARKQADEIKESARKQAEQLRRSTDTERLAEDILEGIL